ncbi:MAG: hypothetical protein PVG98_01735 [Chromatiales bacterium]|jgi:hypothetical protein
MQGSSSPSVRRWAASAAAAGSLLAGSPAHSASNIADNADFAEIARNGFELTVDGSFFADAAKTQFPDLKPNDGDRRNSYAWSSAWWNGGLWIGSNRLPTCQDLDCDRGPAEIWRYTPSTPDPAGDWGLGGTWDKMYESPELGLIFSYFSGLPAETPRDQGYRNLFGCNAGDGVSRLYAATFGLPGRILYWNGNTFQDTPTQGLSTSALNLAQGEVDLGFRGSTCFKGRVWVSPAGSIQDVDASLHPIVYMNPDPAHGAGWQAMVNVADPASSPLADPDNIGIFQMEAMGRYLWFTTINRSTGLELWRGDGIDCLAPWEGDGHCNIAWSKVIDNGAGRPADFIGPVVDNSGATLGVVGDDLYLGAAESGFFAATLAEMIRVPDAGVVPPGGANAPHKWNLLMGFPRRNYAKPAERLPGLENLECQNPGDMANTAPFFWFGQPVTALDDDGLADDCLPTANAGPGFGKNRFAPGQPPNPLAIGPNSYFWRFAYHEGEAWTGSLDITGNGGGFFPGSPFGFDLLKSPDGAVWTEVVNDGFGKALNYGVRALLSVPGLGLVVGTANPFPEELDEDGNTLGGLEIWVGTTAPGGQIPPVADGGGDQLILDEDQDETVDAVLDAGASADPFGGGGIAGYEWFEGSLADIGTTCAGLNANDAFSTDPSTQVALASRIGAQDVVDHAFTLRVTDVDGHVNCDEVTITASYNLPPMVTVTPGVPFRADGDIKLIDLDGNGSERYDVSGLCEDPEDAVVRCEWVAIDDPGVTFSNVHDTSRHKNLCSAAGPCEVFVTVQGPDRNLQPSGSSQPDMYLEVEDDKGYTARLRWETDVQPVVDNPGVNDAPVCRSLVFHMQQGVDTMVEFNPAAMDPPACVDPEGEPLTYRIQSSPALGTAAANGSIVYEPDDNTTPMVDGFDYDALDPEGEDASNASVRVVLNEDTQAPTVAVTFPADGGAYNSAGCGTVEEEICGTAVDDASGVQSVELAIRNESGDYWDANAGAFAAGGPVWHPAVGSLYWHLPFSPPANGDYTLMARAEDLAGFQSPVAEVDFAYFSAGPSDQGGWLRRILALLFRR